MMKISHLKKKLVFTALYIIIIYLFSLTGIQCIFKYALGIECPGCGMTRAVVRMLRFDIIGALRFHPMVWSLPVLYLYFLSDNGIFRRKWADVTMVSVIFAGFVINWLSKFV